MKGIKRVGGSPAIVVAVVALVAALAGSALAGSEQTATGAKSAKKIAKAAKKKAKKANKTAKSAQSSADSAQSAADAAQTSADAAQTSADQATIGRSAYDAGCDPTDNTFIDCVSTTVTLPRAGRVLLNAAGGQSSNTPNGPAQGDCQLEVDDSTAGIPHSTKAEPGEVLEDETTSTAQNGFSITAVTSNLSAGAHTFSMACNEQSNDQQIGDMTISAVMIGAG